MITSKTVLMALAGVLACNEVAAQNSDDAVKFKFYGQIRADLFYNTRANNETVDGLYYLYPKDHEYDADGNDLNATPQGNLYMLYTRAGVDVSGPRVGGAMTAAKLELDVRGSGTTLYVPRIRHAYVNLDWGKSKLLVGQTWHPLFGEVSPSVLNLNTGAPFNPMARAPQVRYRYNDDSGVQFTGAAVWQSQFLSSGPNGKSNEYIKYGNIPEIYAAIDYKKGGWQVGVGAEMLSIKPRRQAQVNGKVYKVNERVTSLSAEAHARYKSRDLTLSAKTTLANNLSQTNMLGGYAVTSIDPHNGEADYTPFRHTMTWVNAVYGTKWQGGLFVGYLKNLGTGKPVVGTVYGVGLDVDQLFSTSLQLSYNVPHWKWGVELTPSTAWFGSFDKIDGRIKDTHSVTNFRIVTAIIYSF